MPPQILVASVTNAKASALKPHLQSVLSLETSAEVDYLYLLDPSASEETGDVLREVSKSEGDRFRVKYAHEKPSEARYAVSEETHHWSQPTFAWLAQQKQRILDIAAEEAYDAVLLVDSDLLLGPETLQSLLSTGQPIVSAVFWTRWTPDAPPLPQVWMEHPYEMQGRGLEAHEHLQNAASRQLWQVAGLGACTLIRAEVLGVAKYWPLLDGLPNHSMWQGEDRHFAVRCQRAHVPLHADAWPDLFHIYRPSDEVRVEEMLLRIKNSNKDAPPDTDDFISAVLEPIEEPNLVGYILPLRGRLGTMKVLPDIEKALREMSPGEDRFVKVKFPIWYEVPEYRGQEKAVRLRLLGVKPFRYAPGLDDAESHPLHVAEPFYEDEEQALGRSQLEVVSD